MKNSKIVKNSTVAFTSALLVTTAITPSLAANAATTYKVKSGKLVNAKTKKVIKGYKVYKGTLYYNGKKKTAYTLYKGTLYYKGKKATGNKLYKGTLYSKGKKSTVTTTYAGKLYVKGKLATGYKVNKGTLYYKGKKYTGYKTSGSVLYYKGTSFTGEYNGKYYSKGKAFKGVRTISGVKVRYNAGKKLTGIYSNQLYVNGIPNTKANYVYGGILYSKAKQSVGTAVYNSKVYVDGKLLTGIRDVNGVLGYYEKGVFIRTVDSNTGGGNNNGGTDNGGGNNNGGTDNGGGNNNGGTDNGGGNNDGGSTTEATKTITELNTTTITNITVDNADQVRALLTAYDKLSAADRAKVTANIEQLKALLAKFEADMKQSFGQINNAPTYTTLDTTTITNAKALLAAYELLSDADKAKVTYPITALRDLVTLYTINGFTATTVSGSNVKEVKALLEQYAALSQANKNKVTFDVAKLQAAYESFKKALNTDYTTLTAANYESAKKLLELYGTLTDADRVGLISLANLQAVIDGYEFEKDAPKFTLITVNNLADVQKLIDAYDELSSAAKKSVKYDMAGLKAMLTGYNFTVKHATLDVTKVSNAQTLTIEYGALSELVRNYLQTDADFKLKLQTATDTLDADTLMKKAQAFGTLSLTDKMGYKELATNYVAQKPKVAAAKLVIADYEKSNAAVQALAKAPMDSLKSYVATWDFVEYYNAYFGSVYSVNVGKYNLTKEISNVTTRQELVYMLSIYAKSYEPLREEFNTQLRTAISNNAIKAFNTEDTTIIPGIAYVNKSYVVTNLDQANYENIQKYNYESTFVYQESKQFMK